MKAWILDEPGSGVRLQEVADPRLRSGGAILRMLAVQVPGYTRALTEGTRGGIATPTVLGIGGIGRVEAVAEDVHTVRPGDIALCTGFLSTGRIAHPEEVLLGWTGIGGRGVQTPATDAMRAVWRTGTFAERALMPGSQSRSFSSIAAQLDEPDAEQLDPVAYELRWSQIYAAAGSAVDDGETTSRPAT